MAVAGGILGSMGAIIELYVVFTEELIDEGRRYYITMDNLKSHLNPQVMALISNHGHKIELRALYYSINGAIKYSFNTFKTRLRLQMPYIVSTQDLRQEPMDGIRSINTFVPYLEHVGSGKQSRNLDINILIILFQNNSV